MTTSPQVDTWLKRAPTAAPLGRPAKVPYVYPTAVYSARLPLALPLLLHGSSFSFDTPQKQRSRSFSILHVLPPKAESNGRSILLRTSTSGSLQHSPAMPVDTPQPSTSAASVEGQCRRAHTSPLCLGLSMPINTRLGLRCPSLGCFAAR